MAAVHFDNTKLAVARLGPASLKLISAIRKLVARKKPSRVLW
jgi:hypothetical protein